MMKRYCVGTLVITVFLVYAFCFGCDSFKDAKDRAAILACVDYGGVKSYSPKLDHLEVKCSDGTQMSVKWLPVKDK